MSVLKPSSTSSHAILCTCYIMYPHNEDAITHFFTNIYIYMSLLHLEMFETNSRWVGERQKWRMLMQTGGGLLYWPFLNPCSDYIFKVLHLYFLDERFSSGFCHSTTWLPALLAHWLLSEPFNCLPDWLTLIGPGYLCIHDFIMPLFPFGLGFPWFAYLYASLVFQ